MIAVGCDHFLYFIRMSEALKDPGGKMSSLVLDFSGAPPQFPFALLHPFLCSDTWPLWTTSMVFFAFRLLVGWVRRAEGRWRMGTAYLFPWPILQGCHRLVVSLTQRLQLLSAPCTHAPLGPCNLSLTLLQAVDNHSSPLLPALEYCTIPPGFPQSCLQVC